MPFILCIANLQADIDTQCANVAAANKAAADAGFVSVTHDQHAATNSLRRAEDNMECFLIQTFGTAKDFRASRLTTSSLPLPV